MRNPSSTWLPLLLFVLAGCDSDGESKSKVLEDGAPDASTPPNSDDTERTEPSRPSTEASDDSDPADDEPDASVPDDPSPASPTDPTSPEPTSSQPASPEPTSPEPTSPEPSPSAPQGDAGAPSPVLPNDGEVRAFPGATGFGALASGGRGGRVIHVTTLAPTGPGSLQAALSTRGPRIIVFEVSGVIAGDIFEIEHGDVTIAGQTAPGGGITLQGRLFAAYDESVGNIILRHVRIRPRYDGSNGAQFDAIQISLNHTIMIDHVSVGYGIDETVDLYSARNVTVQWSTIENPTPEPSHEGGTHNYGLINGPDGLHASVNYNLFAHSRNRNPAIANGPAEVLNNVMYNVRHGFVHHNPASGSFNLVGNTFIAGRDDRLIPFYFDDENGRPAADLGYYVADNWVEGSPSECPAGALDDPWTQCDNDLVRDASFRADAPFDFTNVGSYRATPTVAPAAAYEAVLARAGAFPRDVITRASVADTRAGTGRWGTPLPDDLMEGLTPTVAPADEDRDGMADAWELSRGLDPNDPDDHAEVLDSGYTAIEEYINELAERLLPR